MRYYSSTAQEMSLVGAIDAAATSITVDDTTGLPASTPFTLVVDYGAPAEEIVTVTAVAGPSLTVLRGEDGSAAQSHTPGAVVRHAATARDYRDAQQHMAATTGVHGLAAGDTVVGAAALAAEAAARALLVPKTTTVNGHALSGNVTVTASDVGAADAAALAAETAARMAADQWLVPPVRTINGHSLSTDVALTAADVGAAAYTHYHDASAIVSGRIPVAYGGTAAADAATARANLGITPANIGAAATSHTHSATDITSGALPVTRGGTGAADAAAARTALGVTPANIGAAANGGEGGALTFHWVAAQLRATVGATDVGALAFAASSVDTATHAEGPTSAAYNRPATGTGYFQVWMNDALQFMRNTSARKYKEQIEPAAIDPAGVLALEPVTYHRKETPADQREFGLIADDVEVTLPQIVTYYDGEVDGVRYDLLAVALLAVVKDQQARIEALEAKLA